MGKSHTGPKFILLSVSLYQRCDALSVVTDPTPFKSYFINLHHYVINDHFCPFLMISVIKQLLYVSERTSSRCPD